jgi:predicted RNA-binding Zn ribbon-like protein
MKLDRRGGHPAVDFVNTVSWRGDPSRRHDHLAEFTDLVGWCCDAGLLSHTERDELRSMAMADRRVADRMLKRARQLRESLHAIWTERPVGEVRVVDREYASAMRSRRICIAEGRMRWVELTLNLHAPLQRIAIEAVELLTVTSLSDVKQCGDPECGWLFVDHSRQHNRLWCSTAECGNRIRVRRHYRARGRGK